MGKMSNKEKNTPIIRKDENGLNLKLLIHCHQYFQYPPVDTSKKCSVIV